MPRVHSALCIIASCAVSPSVLAESGPLVGPNLKETIAGRTVIMSMSLGSLPITYQANGTMRASSTAVGLVTGVSSDKGRWWVSGSNLCQKWQNWFSGQQYCHAMSRKGETLYWTRNDGLSGSAKVIR